MSKSRERRARAQGSRRSFLDRRAWLIAVLLLLVVVAVLAFTLNSQAQAFSNPAAVGTTVPSMGGQHVQIGQIHAAYDSLPPTSGPHWDTPADWGVYHDPVPEERWVHNLEHGGIVILYNCPQDCPDLTAKLDALFKTAPRSKLGNVKLLVTPYSKISNRLTLVAWNYYLPLDDYDDVVVRGFMLNHLDKAPEQVM